MTSELDDLLARRAKSSIDGSLTLRTELAGLAGIFGVRASCVGRLEALFLRRNQSRKLIYGVASNCSRLCHSPESTYGAQKYGKSYGDCSIIARCASPRALISGSPSACQ